MKRRIYVLFIFLLLLSGMFLLILNDQDNKVQTSSIARNTAETAYECIISGFYMDASYYCEKMSTYLLRGMWKGMQEQLGKLLYYEFSSVYLISPNIAKVNFASQFENYKVLVVFIISNGKIIDIEWYAGLDMAEAFVASLRDGNLSSEVLDVFYPGAMDDEMFSYSFWGYSRQKIIESYSTGRHEDIIKVYEKNKSIILAEFEKHWEQAQKTAGKLLEYGQPYYLDDYYTGMFCFPCIFENGEYTVGISLFDSGLFVMTEPDFYNIIIYFCIFSKDVYGEMRIIEDYGGSRRS